MSYQASIGFEFEKRLIVNEGNYILYIKIPKTIRQYEYQALGDDGYHTIAEVKVGDIHEKKKMRNSIFLVFENIQMIFFQIKICMENGSISQYHEFINIHEIYKEIKPPQPPSYNIKMVVKEIQEETKKEEDEKEEEEEEEEEDENLK